MHNLHVYRYTHNRFNNIGKTANYSKCNNFEFSLDEYRNT